jgi:hypothetical protein
MAASYAGDPSASTTDLLRMMVGDVGPEYGGGPFLAQDAEVAAFYDPALGLNTSAANLCDAIAARLSVQVDTGAEGVSTRASQRAEAYRKQADRYRALAARLGEPGAVIGSAAAAASSSGAAPVLVGCDRDDDWRWCDRRDPLSWPLPGWR